MSNTNADGLVPIEASVTSTFYRAPAPGEPPFAQEGDQVGEDTVVCLLEVMKCFRSVTAGVEGTVEKILVENAEVVNAGDIVILIRPSG
jgi:biotin carboxyl carrier protein